jgi:hypothetical protein
VNYNWNWQVFRAANTIVPLYLPAMQWTIPAAAGGHRA